MILKPGKLYQFKCDYNSTLVNGTYIHNECRLGGDMQGILWDDEFFIYLSHTEIGSGWCMVHIIYKDMIGYIGLFRYGTGPFNPSSFFNEVPAQ